MSKFKVGKIYEVRNSEDINFICDESEAAILANAVPDHFELIISESKFKVGGKVLVKSDANKSTAAMELRGKIGIIIYVDYKRNALGLDIEDPLIHGGLYFYEVELYVEDEIHPAIIVYGRLYAQLNS